MLNPLLKLLIRICKYPYRFGDAEKTPRERVEGKIESLAEAQADRVQALEEDEKKMIHSIFELGETKVKEIMVPRIDMVCVEEGTNMEEMKNLVRKAGHSRIPLFRESIDQILGIVYVKDLFLEQRKSEEKVDLSRIARKAHFVPENKKIDELLQEMRKEKVHLAIVVDEYGGTAGLVTLEDILEEIVGEIEDEYDKEEPPVKKIDEKSYSVSGKLSIHDLNDFLELDLPEKEFETVGGLIYDLIGGVPEEGKKIEYKGLSFQVEKMKSQRIIRVKVKKLKNPILNPEDK
jgi:CBS domain containing-hemolysin-like protein